MGSNTKSLMNCQAEIDPIQSEGGQENISIDIYLKSVKLSIMMNS